MATVKNGGAIAAKTQSTVAAKKNKPSSVQDWVAAYKSEFAKALPAVITPERFTRMALSAMSKTPKLKECTIDSLLGALMNAASLGVEPNSPLGQAYLIPYPDHGTWKVRFELGFKGIIDLAYRSGEVRMIQAHVVYENDEFRFAYGLSPELFHRPAIGNRGQAIMVYAVFKLVNGGEGFQVMSMDDVRKHAQRYSKSYSKGPWQTNFEEMSKKTVLKKLLKYAPMSSEFVRAVVTDETKQNLRVPDEPGGEIVIDQEIIQVDDIPGEPIQDGATDDMSTAPPQDMPWPDEAPPAAS